MIKHDETKREMIAAIIRADDVLRANEPDHETAILVRLLRESK